MKIITDLQAARAVVPRPAATTLLVRDAGVGLEVLMVRRSLEATFMPGAYVFPGGAVDAADGASDCTALADETTAVLAERIGTVTGTGALAAAFAVAALRECFEECGLWLMAPQSAPRSAGAFDAARAMHRAGAANAAAGAQVAAGPTWAAWRARLHGGEAFAAVAQEAHAAGWPLATSALLPWSHWVTPLGLPKRFDTLFFVAEAPATQVPSVDEGETTTLAWVHPPAGLAAHARGEFPMEFATVAALAAHARAQRSLPPLQPRLLLGGDGGGGRIAIVLPGEAGYDEAALQ